MSSPPSDSGPRARRSHGARSNSRPRGGGTRASAILTLVAAVAVALLVWQLSDLLLLTFGAVIVAAVLQALATPLTRYAHWPERRSVLAVVLLGFSALAAGTWLMGDPLRAQFDALGERIPKALDASIAWLNDHQIGAEILEMWEELKQGKIGWGRVANLAGTTLGALASAAFVLVLGIYLALDPDQYRRGVIRMIPPEHRQVMSGALSASGEALSKWLVGQGISMLFVGTSTALGLAVLGIPLALPVGVVAGILAFIPFFGPIASGVLAVMLAFIEGPREALYVAVLCLAIQQIEGNLLMPLVQRWAVRLPPALGIAAGVIFGILFGITGVLLATPLMVVVMVLVQKLYIEAILERPAAPSTVSHTRSSR